MPKVTELPETIEHDPGPAVALLDRAFDAGSLSELRAQLQRCGASHDLADVALAHFVLAVNEITTNAVRHGRGRGYLRLWTRAGVLVCEIVDWGPGIPRQWLEQTRTRRPGHVGGHGLWLARQICDRIEIETSRTGTRVVLCYVSPRAAAPARGADHAEETRGSGYQPAAATTPAVRPYGQRRRRGPAGRGRRD